MQGTEVDKERGVLMPKLKTMSKGNKTRYAKTGRGRCRSCYDEIKIGDKYTTTGGSGTKRLIYCRACAEEKSIL